MASDPKKKSPYIYIDIDGGDQPPIIAHRQSQVAQQRPSVSGQPGMVMLGGADDDAPVADEAQPIMPLVVPIFRNAIDPDYDAMASSVPEPSVAVPPGYRGAPMRPTPQSAPPLDEGSSVEAYLQKQAAAERKRGLHETGAYRPGASAPASGRSAVGRSSAGQGEGAASAYSPSWRDDAAPAYDGSQSPDAANPYGSYGSPNGGSQSPSWGSSAQQSAQQSQQPSQPMAIQPYNPAYAQWYQQYGSPYGGAPGASGASAAAGWDAGSSYGDPMAGYPYRVQQPYGYGAPDGYGAASAAAPEYPASPYGAPEGTYGYASPGSYPSPYGAYGPYGTAAGVPAAYPSQGAASAYDYSKAYGGAHSSYGQQPPSPVPGASPYAAPAPGTAVPVAEFEGEGVDEIGQPLLDERVIAESSMFDEPSMSLEEGMRGMEDSRRKRKKVIAIVLVVVAVAVLALVVVLGFVLHDDSSDGSPSSSTTQSQSSSSSAASSSSSSRSAAVSSFYNSSSSSSSSSSNGSQAGYMTFQYTATTSTGVSYTCMETVTFKSNGDCEFTTMDMEFPDAESATAFVNSLASDYGSNFTLDSQSGAEAKVTIDNSGLHLNRKEYEQALRASAEDVVILEKK